MKNNAVLTNPLRRKRFEVGDRYLIHVAQDGEEYAVHHTTLVPATWVIVTSITDTAVTDQHPIESRWLNSESRWLNSRGVDDFVQCGRLAIRYGDRPIAMLLRSSRQRGALRHLRSHATCRRAQ